MAQSPPRPTLDAARAHHRAGRLQEAEGLYGQVLAQTPGDPDALHLLGMLAFQTGRHAQAVELVQAALKVRGDDAEMHHDLGNVLEARGDLDGAAASYERTLERAPGHADAHYNLAGVRQKQGRVDDAIAGYRAAIAASPAQGDAYNNLGTLYHAQGRLDDAVAAYRAAAARDPRSPVYLYNLGNALDAQQRFDEAIGAYRASLALAPSHAGTLNNLGHALFGRGNALYAAGRLEDAALSYGDSLAVRPDYAPAHNNLGNVLDELGHPDLALASYRRALALADDPTIGANFARCLRKTAIARDDPDLRALVVRALAVPWARPGELARVAGDLLAFVDDQALTRDPVFLALLTRAPVADPRLEQRVTALRRGLLDGALASAPDSDLVGGCAIARQCFVNEYVFAQSADEGAAVGRLRQDIERALDDGADVPAASLVALAAYVPLHQLQGAQRLLERSWPGPVRALLTQQVAEPREEQALREALPALTPIRDETSQRVRAQYEDNPYPRWIDLPPAAPLPFDAWLAQQVPGAAVDPGAAARPLEILIAGCGTGQEAIETAQRDPRARVLAVDLSRASLAYAQRQTRARSVDNVTYGQADLLELSALGRRFDVVSAVGVLHHLDDPLAGWRALAGCVVPGGLMQIGLYSEAARRDIAAARAFVAARGDAPTPEGIRAARAAIVAEGARFARVIAARDFYAASECRDLLFHVQEQCFTLPRLRRALDELGLAFLGFALEPSVRRAYRLANPDDAAATDLARWEAFERDHPDTFVGMYQFWVRVPASRAA